MCNIKLKNELKEEHLRKFDVYIRNIETKQMERIKRKNEKNLKRLVSFRYGSCPKHSVTNLSSYTLEEKELNALSYGLNFAIPTKKVNKELTYLGFESFLNQVSGLKT